MNAHFLMLAALTAAAAPPDRFAGRIIGVEYFASPKLFSHARAKLLASYAAQALAAPSSPRPAAPPSSRDVATFAAGAERGAALVGKAVDPASGRALQTSYLAK